MRDIRQIRIAASKYLANFVDENRREFILLPSLLELACLGDPTIVIDPEKHVVASVVVDAVRAEQKLSRFCTFAALPSPLHTKLTNLPLSFQVSINVVVCFHTTEAKSPVVITDV